MRSGWTGSALEESDDAVTRQKTDERGGVSAARQLLETYSTDQRRA